MTCRPCPRPATPPDPRKDRGPAQDTRGARKGLPMDRVYHGPEEEDNLRPLTAPELADLTGWDLQRVYALTRAGALPVIRVGRRVYYPRPAILRLLAAGSGREEAASV